MDGNPIDDLIKTNQKLSGITFTPEEIEEMKSSYNGDPELAFQDMVNTVQKARNIKFTYNERLDMKAKYGVPMAWVDIMALSENPDLNPTQKNKAGESSAAGYWQVTKSAHEPTIRKMFGVSHADFIKDPNKQERYVKETLEPVYDKNLSEFRDTAEEGIKEGRFKDYEKYMVNGRFTDDQIKAMNHVLGSSGARYFLNNGSFIGVEQDRKARDIRRTLQQMVGLRKQYGVPASLQDQYNFADVVRQAAEEVTAASTPTLGGGQASVQKGPKIAGQSTDIDWGAGTVTTKFDKKQIKAEAKKKTTTTTPQGQPQFGVGRSVVDLQVTDKGESIQNADEVFKSGAPNERKIKENAWLENTAKAKEITSDFSQYKDKKVDPNNLNDEELKLRDEIQQKLRAEKEVLNSSQYMLKDKYGANVEKDIQDLLSNQSAVIDDISNLEKTIKDKYQGKTPSNADIAPLTKKRAELGDNIRDLVVQQNALNAKAEELNNKLKEFGERPGVTEEEYNRYYNEINKEFANISNQFDALGADIGRLNQDYEQVRLQEQSLIDKYNEEASNINSQYAADSDVQKLKTKLGEYNKNLGRIQKYQEDPFFNSYLDSLYNITDLGKSYKNLFPDVLEGEERSKELAKLARDIVKKEKTEYWSPQNIFIDLYNGVKSLYTDAPATGVFSTLLNSLKTASYNIAGDFIGAAATISDAVGAEDIARKLRVGDLYGANVTRMNIEQDVTRSAVRSDIQGNPVEEYYTVKDSDDVLFSTGLQPGDRIIVEDGKPVAYRGEDGFKKNLNLIPGTNPDKIVEDFVKSKPKEEDFSFVRTATSSLPSIIDMASLIGFNYAAIPRISRLFAKAGARSAAGLAANFGMQTFQQYGDLYSSYLQKGLSPGDAAKYALGQSAGVALIELFNPLEMKVASLGGDAAVSSFRKIIDTSVDLFARGKIGTKDLIANVGIGAATALKEAGIEGATELVQGEFENIVENYATNGNKSTSMNDSLNTLATTLAVVALPSISMGRAAYRNAKSDVITSSIFKAAQNKEQFLKDLDKAVENGKLEISEAAGIKNYVEYIKDELDEYGTITDNQGAALTGLIGTRYYYENKKKNSTNETAKKEIDKKIEEINKTIQDVVSGAKKPEVDPFVAEFVGEKGKDKEAPAKEDINTKKAYDFDDTLFDNKTGKLTKLGEDVKKRIEAGEDIVIVTARGENQTQQIQDVLGVGVDKIEATGDEAKKPEALQKRGISPQEYYDENQEKLAAIQGVAAPSTTAAGAMTKEQQAELDKVSKRAERIQRTLQEDAAVQEEGDEPLLTAEQKKILETELQTLNQRRDAIQKQSTAEVPIQPGAEGGPGVGGQVQAKPEGPAGKGKGKEAKAEVKVEEQITDKEFKKFVDKNQVTPARIESISNKVINNETLSSREQQIFTSRTTDVNKKIQEIAAAQKQAQQATEAAGPTPTTTTTEKVAPEAGKAPQKANTVQGFELTKKDGTKAAPAEYRKNEKGKWGKVNAKGGVTPVSSPAQVKQLEDALSSQAAAETKAEITPQPINVYHGGDVVELSVANKKSPLFVSEDESQAKEYTKENKGKVVSFKINNKNIAPEEKAYEIINKLGLKSKQKGWDINELNLFELIDKNFDTSLSENDIEKVFKELEKEGFGGIRFYDTNLKTLKQDIQNIVVFNPELVNIAENELAPGTAQASAGIERGALQNVESTTKALKGKTKGLLTEPTTEQLAKEAKDKNVVTFNFDKESDVPNAFKDKISSRGEVNGKKVIRVTLPKSMADYLLAKDDPQAISEAYHKAKKDGSNPALVEAVEGLLGVAPSQPAAAQTSKAQRIIDEQKKATQLSKEISKKIKDIMSLSKSMFNRFGVKTRVVDKKTLQKEIRAKFKDLAFSRTGAPVISATKPEGKISEKDFKDLKNLADELGFTLSATRNKTYAVYLDNLTGTIYYNSEADIKDPVKNLQDLYDANSVADLKNKLDELLPEEIQLINQEDRLSNFYIAIPDLDIIQEYTELVNFEELSRILLKDSKNLDRDLEIIRKYKNDLDWYILSTNPSLNLTPEIIKEFKDKWDWYNLSTNPSLNPTLEMLREFKDKWLWRTLSRNRSLNPTPEMLKEFKDKWDWEYLSLNPSLNPTLEMLKEFKDNLDFDVLSANQSLNPTPEIIKEFKDKWDWRSLSSNRSLNPTPEMLREFKNKWDWWYLNSNRSLNPTLEMLKEFKDNLDFDVLSANQSLNPTLEMLKEFKDNLDFDVLSANQSLNPTPEIIKEFKDKWDWKYLSSNPSLNPTLEMLREFKDEWYWGNLSSNPSLNPTLEMLKEFKNTWNWASLSANQSFNPTLEILKEFKYNWYWASLSANQSFNPTLEILREFKNNWDWWSISGHRNFNITKEIANEFKNYIDWTEASRQNKLKPWHLDYVGINVKSANKAKFTKLSSVGLPTESVRHYFPLFTGKNSEQIINYWMDTWKSGLTTVESATTNPDLINSDVKNDYKGGGFVVFSNDSNFLFYSPEDNYSIPTKTKKIKGPKNLKYATRSEALVDSSRIKSIIDGMDLNNRGRDEWIIELSPANIDYIQFNLKEGKVKIRELTSNGVDIWEGLFDEVNNSFAITTFVSYLENYTSDKETFLFALEDLGMDAFHKQHPMHEDGKKVYQYLKDLVINDKIDNFSGNIEMPDFLQNLNDEFGVEIRLTSPDGKKTKTIPRKTINTFLSKSGGEVWGFYDNNLKEAVLRSDAPIEATVHEAFTHPFLEAAKVQNPKLYNSLLKQAAAKKEIKESVDKDYKDKTRAERNDEYIARAIDKYVKGELDAIKDKGLIKAILDFFKNISDNLKSFLDLPTSVKDISPDTTLKELAQYSLYGKGTIDLTTQPTPIAAETQVEVETKTAEQLSEDIQASIEAETAKEKMQTKDPVQMAGQDLVNNPESASSIPDDVAAALLEYAEGLKINLGGFKKICK